MTGLNPALLELELTESILIQDTENVLAAVKRLKLMGIKLSIDWVQDRLLQSCHISSASMPTS